MPYTLLDALNETRVHLKDKTENVWTTLDMKVFVNDAIRIIKSSLPLYFTNLVKVTNNADTIVIKDDYTYLIPLFVASRCFAQDEQHYRATTFMNEFETRKAEMVMEIMDSDEYAILVNDLETEVVRDVYFNVEDTDEVLPLNP